jgi:hypothetical protein
LVHISLDNFSDHSAHHITYIRMKDGSLLSS